VIGGAFAFAPVFLSGNFSPVQSLRSLWDGQSSADDAGIAPGFATKVARALFASEAGGGAYATRTLDAVNSEIPKAGKAVVADLGEMMIRVYADGVMEKEYPILSKGKPGSLWETPTGAYQVKTKEENHFSSIGSVWMPYSMQFFGNFFIHGWPHYVDGSAVPEGFSGGCIRLSDESAKDLFTRVEVGVPVIVVNGTEIAAPKSNEEDFHYFTRDAFVAPPKVSAEGVFVADLDNSFVFYEKHANDARSIASVSKLMTALISVEAVNQYRDITLSTADVDAYGDTADMIVGKTYPVGELLWPLLLPSSNDAAYAIARTIGVKHFVSLMNEKASGLGLVHTKFYEPSGLDPRNVSSPIDLFRLTQHLWTNKRSLLDVTKNRNHKNWRNIHPFAAKSSFLGGKTGYIPEADKTVVAVFSVPFGEFADRPVAIVMLGSDDIRSDVERMRVWVKNNFYYGTKPLESQPKPLFTRSASKEPFSLLFVGDIMMNRGVEGVIQKEAGGNWDFPFQFIAGDLRNADVTFANLEGPVSDKGVDKHNLYSFRMDPGIIESIKDAGVDVVSLANNHVGDWGREAFEDTMRRLRRASVQYAGAGWNKAEAISATSFDVKGKRVGYLAFSDVGPTGLAAGDAASGIAIASVEVVQSAVRQAKEANDILVVSFHFGDEYQQNPSKRQRTLARAAIDAGARIVVGHHPHVVQSVEEYDGGVIMYSLGNFIFDQNFSEDTMSGMMVKIEFEGDKIAAIIPMPITINKSYQPSLETGPGGD
jgi:poly-gamma-glutamate synthesis protein (capsule biosynthesis protein)